VNWRPPWGRLLFACWPVKAPVIIGLKIGSVLELILESRNGRGAIYMVAGPVNYPPGCQVDRYLQLLLVWKLGLFMFFMPLSSRCIVLLIFVGLMLAVSTAPVQSIV